jgi:hypothetical protein
MADPTPAPPKSGLWARLKAWPRSLSLAARAAWVIFGILLLLVTTVWTIYFVDAANLPYREWMSWSRMAAILALVVAIPVLAYFAMRLWLEGDATRFPDIDYAWKAGLEALRRAGLKIEGSPIFLVIGSASSQEAKNLLDASGMTFRVAGLPEGRSPLTWYANPDGIWLFCTEVGWLSALARLAERKQLAGVIAEDWSSDATSTVNLPEPAQAAAPAPQTLASTSPQAQARLTDSTRGTIMLDQFVLQQPAPVRPAPTTSPAPTASPAPVTMTVQPRASQAERVLSTSALSQQPAIVPPQDSAEQLQRLEYVCQLLRQARQPLCAINGIIALTSFEQLLATAPEIEEVQRAIKSDLLTIQRGLALRCPVSSLVVGLERERGFRELVRRVGPERAFAQRFGRRYDLRSECSAEALQNFAAHVGGVFEDWIYTLFRENQALSRPGNTTLYGLLCKMRCNVKPRLGEILAGGFGYDQRQTPHDDPILFSGCYFAATGESHDRQAFVKGVMEKLLEEQENVEWTRLASRDEQRSLQMVYVGAASFLGLAALFVGLVIRRWM